LKNGPVFIAEKFILSITEQTIILQDVPLQNQFYCKPKTRQSNFQRNLYITKLKYNLTNCTQHVIRPGFPATI